MNLEKYTNSKSLPKDGMLKNFKALMEKKIELLIQLKRVSLHKIVHGNLRFQCKENKNE